MNTLRELVRIAKRASLRTIFFFGQFNHARRRFNVVCTLTFVGRPVTQTRSLGNSLSDLQFQLYMRLSSFLLFFFFLLRAQQLAYEPTRTYESIAHLLEHARCRDLDPLERNVVATLVFVLSLRSCFA